MEFNYIIKALLDKGNYNKFRPSLAILEEQLPVVNLLDQCHSLTESNVTISEMKALGGEALYPVVEAINKIDVSDNILSEVVKTHLEKVWAYRQAMDLIDVYEGRKSLAFAIHEPLEEKDILKEQEQYIIPKDLDILLQETDRSGGLQWRLPSLQQHVGGLHKGDFGIIFARPEAGKTTFLVSEFGYMAQQKRGCVLHFNNEERGVKVMMRYYEAIHGVTRNEIRKDPDKFGLPKEVCLTLFDKAAITSRDVERLIKEVQPAVIVFDQIDKIKGFTAERPDLAVGKIYQWAREIAKEVCPVVGVCQAAGTAEDKKWLEMGDMAESKTAKPAEADFIIGIGKITEGYENTRFLHLIKNKLTGSHAKITCIIEPQIGRYRDVD